MNDLEKATDLTKEQEAERSTIRGIYAAALAKAKYADDMHRQNPSREVHELIDRGESVVAPVHCLSGTFSAALS